MARPPLRKNLLRICFVALLSLAGYALTQYDVKEIYSRLKASISAAQHSIVTDVGSESAPPTADRSDDTIHVASFNIQVFGLSKLKKKPVMDVLADVVRRFDVVAVQELRAKDQSVIPRFVELINSDGSRYDYVVGPRLGRSSSKEQYVYLFDTSRIQIARRGVYTIIDRQDLLHREPLVARFRVRGPPPEEAFTFTLVDIHTDPDETRTELDALDDVVRTVRRNGGNEDDVILLGDLNVDEQHLGELGQMPNMKWVIEGEPTNTLGTKSYDNILFDNISTLEYTGRHGVLDLMSEYDLTMDEAIEISDHLPVWAEFRVREGAAPQIAQQPGDTTSR